MQYFVFETFLVSQVINLNNSTLSPDRWHENEQLSS